MYQTPHFEEKRTDVIHALMREYPLAALVVSTPEGLVANHIPFHVTPEPAPFGTLRGHLAKANPLWKVAGESAQALAIFQGPHGYVSPSWYATKLESGKVVPTWNYVVAHAHGTIRFIQDASWLRSLTETLTDQHESARPHPWKVSDAPADYTARMINSIVGLEFSITRLEGKWKLGQNRSAADQRGVAAGLIESCAPLAAAMVRAMAKVAD